MLNSLSASSIGPRVDLLFFSLLALCLVIFLSVAATTGYFLVKYRRGTSVDRSRPADKNFKLEMGIFVGFAVIMVALFIWSARAFFDMHTPPNEAMDIFVMSKQWMWKFEHPNGRGEINELHVPVDEDIKLILSSDDVVHSLFIPEFRIKQDALPNRYTTTWFRATRVGVYPLRCTQYCGTDHALMLANVVVVSKNDFAAWEKGIGVSAMGAVAEAPSVLLQRGKALFESIGCNSCHATDNAKDGPKFGPSLAGLFGKTVLLADGRRVVADEDYLRESISEPARKIVKGYYSSMPIYRDSLKAQDIAAIVLYLKGLGAK